MAAAPIIFPTHEAAGVLGGPVAIVVHDALPWIPDETFAGIDGDDLVVDGGALGPEIRILNGNSPLVRAATELVLGSALEPNAGILLRLVLP